MPGPSDLPPVPEEQRYVRGHDGTRLFVRTAGPAGSWRVPSIAERREHRELQREERQQGRSDSDTPPPTSWRIDHEAARRTTARTAILCDGVLCDGFIWRHLFGALSRMMPVAHWNYRGHGRSAAPEDMTNLGPVAHGRDLSCVREAIGNPEVVLFGHSMGTQVALENYLQNPEGVKGLVLMCGSFGRVTHTFRGLPLLELMLPKILEFEQKHPYILRALWSNLPTELAYNVASRMRDVDPDRIRHDDLLPYLQHQARMDPGLFLRMLREAGTHSVESKLAEIDVPVLIIAAELDTFTPATLSVYMSEALPRARLVMVKGGSHVAPLEQPELFENEIRTFLESLT